MIEVTLRRAARRMAGVLAVASVAVALPIAQASSAAAIMGGEEAPVGAFPYTIDVKAGGSHYCGGAIVNQEWVLTAAHCAQQSTSAYSLEAGSRSTVGGVAPRRGEGATSDTETSGVSEIVRYPGYNPLTHSGDLALMHLSSPLRWNGGVAPVTLPAQGSDPAPATTAVLSGWGATSAASSTESATLRDADAPVVSRASCQADYGLLQPIGQGELCASAPGESFCRGDDGDPLAVDGTLVGIAVFHDEPLLGILTDPGHCRAGATPDVYTNVGAYSDWINAVAQP